MKVGVIGLGTMGLAITRRLIEHTELLYGAMTLWKRPAVRSVRWIADSQQVRRTCCETAISYF